MTNKKHILRIPNMRASLDIQLLCFILLVSSWQFIMPVNWLDEIGIVLLAVYMIVKKCKFESKYLITIGIYSIWCFAGIFINGRINLYALIIWIDWLKPVVLFVMILSLKLTKEKRNQVITWFEIVSIPSIIIGIINALRYNIWKLDLLIDSGTLKMVDGILVERAGGLIGHSGIFTETCAVLFIIALFGNKQGILRFAKLAFYFVGVYVGRGRLPLGVVIVALLWYFWQKVPHHLRKKMVLASLCGIAPAVYALYQYFVHYFAVDIEHQIRFVALQKFFDLFGRVALFGLGCGSLGNSNSWQYNKNLYMQFGLTRSSFLSDWESTLAKSLIQVGIVGTICWYWPFVNSLMSLISKKGKAKNVALFLMCYFIFNTFFNKVYSLPWILVVFVLVAVEQNEKITYNEDHMTWKA